MTPFASTKLDDGIRQAVRRTRATVMHDEFTAWRQRDGGKAQRLEFEGSNLPEVLNSTKVSCWHKDVLLILHRNAVSGDSVLHVYVIRQGKPEWRHCPETKATKQIRPEKPGLLFSLPVNAFDPVEPWVWTPDADVVGHDFQEVRHG